MKGVQVLSLMRTMSRSASPRLRRAYLAIVLGLTTFGILGVGAAAASASFPSSPTLDNFAPDAFPSMTRWTDDPVAAFPAEVVNVAGWTDDPTDDPLAAEVVNVAG